MAQEQSIEAARARIQRLVDEIATLSKSEVRSEEYFQQFLTRAVQAADAKGGAVWLVGKAAENGQYEFQLAAAVEFEESLFQSDEQQRANLLRYLGEVVKNKKPGVFPASNIQGAEPGALQTHAPAPGPEANRTPYPFIHVPLFLKDQVLGVLQMWLQPYVTPQNYQEFATFLTSLATHVEQHLQSRRLGTLVLETQRLQHLLKFASDVAGSLDPLEVSRLASSYGRDLVGCERCSVLTLEGNRWQVLAISGQETVEKKSSMVKAMAAFVGVHARPEVVMLSKKELIARAEAYAASADGNGATPGAPADAPVAAGSDGSIVVNHARTDEIDLAYFQLSHVVSAAIAPLLDNDKRLVGAYFAESTVEGFFEGGPAAKEPTAATRIAEWLANHTSRSLQAAQDYQSLPLLKTGRRIRNARLALTGQHRRRTLVRLMVFLGIVAAILLYPKMDRVDGNCVLQPMQRAAIVPEIPGRVEKVFVREGTPVKKGDPIAQLDTRRLETELEQNEQEKRRYYAESERQRGLGDEASAQSAYLQARVSEENEKRLRMDIEAATLRTPIDGRVVTKDVELHTGEAIQPGTVFAEVASFDDWELQMEVDEKKIGKVERAMPRNAKGSALDVNFILYSQSSVKLHGQLENFEQISAAAHPRETEHVFILTIPKVAIPAELRPALRPGLTGRAKIDLQRRPLVVIWGKAIWNWFRMRMIG
jgi:multidrug efflux pump subunit AcrA (membrane-fusion protein)